MRSEAGSRPGAARLEPARLHPSPRRARSSPDRTGSPAPRAVARRLRSPDRSAASMGDPGWTTAVEAAEIERLEALGPAFEQSRAAAWDPRRARTPPPRPPAAQHRSAPVSSTGASEAAAPGPLPSDGVDCGGRGSTAAFAGRHVLGGRGRHQREHDHEGRAADQAAEGEQAASTRAAARVAGVRARLDPPRRRRRPARRGPRGPAGAPGSVSDTSTGGSRARVLGAAVASTTRRRARGAATTRAGRHARPERGFESVDRLRRWPPRQPPFELAFAWQEGPAAIRTSRTRDGSASAPAGVTAEATSSSSRRAHRGRFDASPRARAARAAGAAEPRARSGEVGRHHRARRRSSPGAMHETVAAPDRRRRPRAERGSSPPHRGSPCALSPAATVTPADRSTTRQHRPSSRFATSMRAGSVPVESADIASISRAIESPEPLRRTRG